jgi:hypothetical protein
VLGFTPTLGQSGVATEFVMDFDDNFWKIMFAKKTFET